MNLNEILAKAMSMGASDVHLKHGLVPVIRLHGELYPLDLKLPRLTGEHLREIAKHVLPTSQHALLETRKEIDCGYGVSGLGRFRVNIFRQRGSWRIVIRAIRDKVPNLVDLHLPKGLERISSFERGLVLVTGVTGSGKSTTMASLIDHINRTKNRHIITIEDPIEYLIQDRKSLITQRELGADTDSFSHALRAALRQDPDVILIGEMRDRETISTAILAAETGHLVISTLHTADAQETINRILSVYETGQQQQVRLQLAAVLQAIVSQRLAKRADGKGLIPAVEVLFNTARIRELIVKPERTHDIRQAIEEGHVGYGMQSFDQSLMQLLSENLIHLEEALSLSTNPDDFQLRFKGITSQDGKRWENFDRHQANSAAWNAIPNLEVHRIEATKPPEEETNPEEPTIELELEQAVDAIAKKVGGIVKKLR